MCPGSRRPSWSPPLGLKSHHCGPRASSPTEKHFLAKLSSHFPAGFLRLAEIMLSQQKLLKTWIPKVHF